MGDAPSKKKIISPLSLPLPRACCIKQGLKANSWKQERGSGGNREICNPAKGSANLCQRPPLLLPRSPPKSKGRGGAGLWLCSEPTASTGFINDVYIVLSCFLFFLSQLEIPSAARLLLNAPRSRATKHKQPGSPLFIRTSRQTPFLILK